MDSYIVRVYRRSKSNSGEEEVAGMVEDVGTDQRLSFQTFSGLVSRIKQVVGRSEAENKMVYKLHETRK